MRINIDQRTKDMMKNMYHGQVTNQLSSDDVINNLQMMLYRETNPRVIKKLKKLLFYYQNQYEHKYRAARLNKMYKMYNS